MEINKRTLYQHHIVIFLYPLAPGRTSAVKSEDNDRLTKVAENITALDKRMVIKFCADIECELFMKLKTPFRYLVASRVLQKLY